VNWIHFVILNFAVLLIVLAVQTIAYLQCCEPDIQYYIELCSAVNIDSGTTDWIFGILLNGYRNVYSIVLCC